MVDDYSFFSELAMNVVKNCLVVTLQGEFFDEKFMRIRNDILKKIYSRTIRGMIVDLSAVRVLDRYAFNALTDVSKMALLLGVRTIFTGLQPGVVSALVDLEVDVSSIRTALRLDDAFIELSLTPRAYTGGEKDGEVLEGDEHEYRSDGDKWVS